MKARKMTQQQITRFLACLKEEERSAGTLEKYRYELACFWDYLPPDDKSVDKARAQQWKEVLVEKGYAVSTVNGMLVALNRFFDYMGWSEYRIKKLRRQRRVFCEKERELSKAEYLRLLAAAQRKGDQRLLLIMQTICSTGIRISELEYITAEAAHRGRADVLAREKAVRCCCRHSCAKSCANGRKLRESKAARCSSPKAAEQWTVPMCGRL